MVPHCVEPYINYGLQVLGIIAINWQIIADQSPQNIFDPDCLKLGDLHSDAVDFQKSGQPVSLSTIPKLKFKAKPDWNAPETVTSESDRYYESTKAIGRLFRSIELRHIRSTNKQNKKRKKRQQEHQPSLDQLLAAIHLDDDEEEDLLHTAVEGRVARFIEVQSLEKTVFEEVSQIFSRYASELQAICITYSLTYTKAGTLTEEEAMIGTISAKCPQPRRRKDLMGKLREQTGLLVTGIREDLLGDEGLDLEDALLRGWVAWKFSDVQQEVFGAKSFGWVALGVIFETIKDIDERDHVEGSRI